MSEENGVTTAMKFWLAMGYLAVFFMFVGILGVMSSRLNPNTSAFFGFAGILLFLVAWFVGIQPNRYSDYETDL